MITYNYPEEKDVSEIIEKEENQENLKKYSPMMQHYIETKEKYKDCILFYRLGDFYEIFFDDAVNVSR